MGDWILGLPVLGMAVLILGATYLVTAGIYLVVTRLATGERGRAFKAISPGVLPPLAIIFALLVGFLAAQVWNDADRAGAAVNREASAPRASVLLAAAFPGETEARLRELLRRHIEDAVIAMVHSDNRAANRTILAIFATGVGASILLIASHTRPFTGELSVPPAVLLQVMPEAGPAAPQP